MGCFNEEGTSVTSAVRIGGAQGNSDERRKEDYGGEALSPDDYEGGR